MNKRKQKISIERKAKQLYPDYQTKGTFDALRCTAFIVGANYGLEIGLRAGKKEALLLFRRSQPDNNTQS
jgi:hypothetical protein